MDQEKVNYAPPGWLIAWFDQIKLDSERAQKFNDFRQRLCAVAGNNHKDFPSLHPNALWMIALDLLLEYEPVLLAEIKAQKERMTT